MTEEQLKAFLDRPNLTPEQQALKNTFLHTNELVRANMQDRERIMQALKQKEEEFLKLQGELNAYVKVIQIHLEGPGSLASRIL